MPKPYARPSTPEDCAELAVTRRDADRTELAVGTGSPPYDALMRGVVYSRAPQTIVGSNGGIVAIFGVVPMGNRVGSPWMLASDALSDISLPFLRASRGAVAEMHRDFDYLHNEVWEGNHLHIKWLKWLGFTVSPAPISRPHFLPFWRTNQCVNPQP